jgi:hypothetical protein
MAVILGGAGEAYLDAGWEVTLVCLSKKSLLGIDVTLGCASAPRLCGRLPWSEGAGDGGVTLLSIAAMPFLSVLWSWK